MLSGNVAAFSDRLALLVRRGDDPETGLDEATRLSVRGSLCPALSSLRESEKRPKVSP